MDKGELITIYYSNMKVNRPIPWIGMPVYYHSTDSDWYIVIDGGAYTAAPADIGRASLCSYKDESPDAKPHPRNGLSGGLGYKWFTLPGEPDAPPMTDEFVSRLDLAYDWGDSYLYENGVWRKHKRPINSKRHMTLLVPFGADPSVVFPNNSAPASVQNLKQLNTDGRTQCAKCKEPLTSLWIGNTNLSHCPVCEP